MPEPPQRSTRPSKSETPGKSATPGQKAGARASDLERALVLRDVMTHAVAVQREVTRPTPLRKARGTIIWATIVCVPLLAVSAYSWLARPEFIWGPRERALAPERREANIRFAMFLLAQRLEWYRRTEGLYPSSLLALGENADGIAYDIVSDSVFELRASESGKAIVLRSDQPVDAFLGNSPALVGWQAP